MREPKLIPLLSTRQEFSLADAVTVPPRSFVSISQSGLLNRLVNQCSVSEAWDPNSASPEPPLHPFNALWDTGATNSMISQSVVDACGLLPISFGNSRHAQGTTTDVPIFLVNIALPNKFQIVGVRVMRGAFDGLDVLIGMDIITMGDFAVTNPDGTTKFSFRIPSQADIDFVRESNYQGIMQASRATPPGKAKREVNRRKRQGRR